MVKQVLRVFKWAVPIVLIAVIGLSSVYTVEEAVAALLQKRGGAGC